MPFTAVSGQYNAEAEKRQAMENNNQQLNDCGAFLAPHIRKHYKQVFKLGLGLGFSTRNDLSVSTLRKT